MVIGSFIKDFNGCSNGLKSVLAGNPWSWVELYFIKIINEVKSLLWTFNLLIPGGNKKVTHT